MRPLLKPDLQTISRREFLTLTGRFLGALLVLPLIDKRWLPASALQLDNENKTTHGRILSNNVGLYSKPSYSSKLQKMYWKDLVFPITAVTVGDEEPAHNRVWYELNGEGFVHSGSVQPVEVRNNPSVTTFIPRHGLLAEVTVPFTDAVWYPRRPDYVAYRLYYSSTHWVKGIYEDDDGKLWYRLWDDKWLFDFYADPNHLHIIGEDELTPISPEVDARDKRLEILREDQTVVAYEDDQPVFMTKAATGAHFSDGDFTTPEGVFHTNRKRPSRHMAAGDRAAPNSYDLPGVPWVCYLTKSGISFHGTYWHNDFGKTRSHGCINVTSEAARWIYRWTLPEVPFEKETYTEKTGTRVDVI